jgi:glycosyltransferase involved in cell wall biosynthesis
MKTKHKGLPLVSICTPTFNRRPFIPYIIKCVKNQTYPKHKLEWVIIDDGTDKIEDLVKDIPLVKYVKFTDKMTLGKKRNIAHSNCKGDIIVYMDDDDYYPPDRIMHAVQTLQRNPRALCAGSSELHIFFKHVNKMYQFGPYGPNHSTAATFAFKKKLLEITGYDDNSTFGEEQHFLKNYTIPFVQLDVLKTILVFSHEHNTLDKKQLLENIEMNKFVNLSTKTVDDFMKDPELKKFYSEDIDKILLTYSPGKLENKPDVLKQLDVFYLEKDRFMLEQHKQQLTNTIINQNKYLETLTNENKSLKEKIEYLEFKISTLIKEKIAEKKGLIMDK